MSLSLLAPTRWRTARSRRTRRANSQARPRLEWMEDRTAPALAGPVEVTGGIVIVAVEGQPFSDVTVATFVDLDGPEDVGNYHATIDWGDGSPVSDGKIVAGPTTGGKVDVLFLTDTTGSMGEYISGIQTAFGGILDAVASGLPGMSIEYAVADYKDYFDGGNYTTYGVNLDQGFTSDPALAQSAIDGLSATGGDDLPESNLKALQVSAINWVSGTGDLAFGGRADAQKLVVWAGDAPGHYLGESLEGVPSDYYPSLADTLTALQANGIKVIGLDLEAQHFGIDENYGGEYQEEYLTSGTGGVATYEVGSGGSTVEDAVVNAIVTTVTQTFLVQGDHTYNDPSSPDLPGSNPYQVTITVHHEEAAEATGVSTALVSNPSVELAGLNISAVKGVTFTEAVATFTDPGGPEDVGDYHAVIDWGDGTAPSDADSITLSGGVFTVIGTHSYAEETSPDFFYSVTVTVNHETAEPATAAGTAVVTSPAELVGVLSGMLYLDHNDNGARDAGEPPAADWPGRPWTVYVDLNDNGVLDDGEPATPIDADGEYRFEGLEPGLYVLRVHLMPGDVATSHPDGLLVDLTGGGEVRADDVGVRHQLTVTPVEPIDTIFHPGKGADEAEDVVMALYRAILGREADVEGLAVHAAALREFGHHYVVDALWNSDEHRAMQVEAYYQLYLGRDLDTAAQGWIDALKAGLGEEFVAAGILASPEFTEKFASNEEFARALYPLLLGREALDNEYWAHVAALDGGLSREMLVKMILRDEPEVRGHVVDSLFSTTLERNADPTGMESWGDLLATRAMAIEDVACALLCSDEFVLKAHA